MNSFYEIINYFDDEFKTVFNSLDEVVVSKITELRIRRNMPLVIIVRNSVYFIDYNGDIYDYPTHNSLNIDSEKFDELFLKLCNYSVYSEMDAMKQGYLTLSNGSRIGVASSCVYEENRITAVKDITSLNIRIAKEINGSANSILNCLYVNSFPSIIVAGKPNSGKTTILRDLAYQLSNGFNNKYYKVSIIDERNEIAGKKNTDFSTKIGLNTDVLSGFSKAKGIEIATRTLSPNLIVCDEISTQDEFNNIKYAFSSGVSFALSIHISSIEDFKHRKIAKELLYTNEFKYLVLLDDYTYQPKIIDISEVKNEVDWNDDSNSIVHKHWSFNNNKS